MLEGEKEKPQSLGDEIINDWAKRHGLSEDSWPVQDAKKIADILEKSGVKLMHMGKVRMTFEIPPVNKEPTTDQVDEDHP